MAILTSGLGFQHGLACALVFCTNHTPKMHHFSVGDMLDARDMGQTDHRTALCYARSYYRAKAQQNRERQTLVLPAVSYISTTKTAYI